MALRGSPGANWLRGGEDMTAKTLLRGLRFRLRSSIAHVPALYLPLADMRRRDADGATIVTPTSELVVEAYPRCGNTFTVAALRMCESRRLEIAHHTHAPAQLIRAVRLGRPALLIIRQPRDSVLSFVMRHPQISIELGLWWWIRFHRAILGYLDGITVASFEQVTTDLGKVIDTVNARFGIALPRFDHTPENVQAVFAAIEARYSRRFGEGKVDESGVARPSADRARRKEELFGAWDAPRLAVQRQRAAKLYARIAACTLVGDGQATDAGPVAPGASIRGGAR